MKLNASTLMIFGLPVMGTMAAELPLVDMNNFVLNDTKDTILPAHQAARNIEGDRLGPPKCNIPSWEAALTPETKKNIDSLRHQSDCSAPSRTQQRVACNWGSGIYVYNDNSYDIHPNCSQVADLAEWITKDCDKTHYSWPGQPPYHEVQGEIDSEEHAKPWGVVVGKADC